MAEMILKAGALSFQKDITGKKLFRELKAILPESKLPPGFTHDDMVIKIGGNIIDPLKVNLDCIFYEDVEIILAPKGFDPITIGIAIAVSLAASFLLTPAIPATSGAAEDSPNNSLFGQTNTIRLNEMSPNIYGQVVSYPDLLVTEGGAWEYIDNQKIVKEVFLIGRGSYLLGEPRFELTPFSDIAGQSYATYQPGQLVPQVQGQFNSEAIDGQTLLGPNNDEVQQGTTAISTTATVGISSGVLTATVDKNSDWDDIFAEVGAGTVTASYSYEAQMLDFISPGSCSLKAFDSSGIILTMVDNGPTYTLTIEAQSATETNCSIPGYGTNFEVMTIVGTSVDVTLPIKTDELQISFDFRAGLRGEVQIAVYVDESTGTERYDFKYDRDTIDQLYFTEKIAISPPAGDLNVSLVRLNFDKEDNSDRVQVSQVATNTYRANVSYGNRTVLTTERKATEQATQIRDSKVNIDATRKTVSYDINTGQVITTLNPSRSFADAMLHEYTQVQGLPPEDLPLDELYQIAESIPENFGYFDYTFADKEQSIKQRLDIIANVARCAITYTGQGYKIYRDEQRFPVAQFDARNISAESEEEVSFKGVEEVSNDGVKLTWRNPDDNKEQFIYYVIQGSNSVECVDQGGGDYVPEIPINPYEVELNGCQDEGQAQNRADLECRRLIYVQETIRITTLVDGENVDRGQVVKYADYYQDDIATGEIAGINGNDFTTYGKMEIPSGDYYITATDQYGGLIGPTPCTITGDFTFTASLPDSYIADGYTIQCGSRFVISSIEQNESSLFVVSDKQSNTDGTVSLELVQYSQAIYPELD